MDFQIIFSLSSGWLYSLQSTLCTQAHNIHSLLAFFATSRCSSRCIVVLTSDNYNDSHRFTVSLSNYCRNYASSFNQYRSLTGNHYNETANNHCRHTFSGK